MGAGQDSIFRGFEISRYAMAGIFYFYLSMEDEEPMFLGMQRFRVIASKKDSLSYGVFPASPIGLWGTYNNFSRMDTYQVINGVCQQRLSCSLQSTHVNRCAYLA